MLPVVSGQVGGDEGAGAGGTLDHQQSLTPSSHDAVALRKGVGVGPGVDGKFRDDRAMAVRDSFRQGHVLGRIELAQSGTQHRDGSTLGCKSPLVGRGVDSARQSRDDGEARMGELERELPGAVAPVVGCLA